MADTIPSNETVASALDGTERGHCIQSDADRYWTPSLFKTYINPLTTKGDVAVYGTANTRLAVGTNGQILIADSVQATGLKWGNPVSPGYKTGRFYSHPYRTGTSTSGITVNTVYYIPVKITEPITAIKLGMETTVSASAGGLAVLGIYAMSGGLPSGAALVTSSAIDTSVAAAVLYPNAISQALAPGWYCLAINTNDVAPTDPTLRLISVGTGSVQEFGVASTTASGTTGFSESHTYDGTLPTAHASPTLVTSALPYIWFEV